MWDLCFVAACCFLNRMICTFVLVVVVQWILGYSVFAAEGLPVVKTASVSIALGLLWEWFMQVKQVRSDAI